jgi:hypothetical protein
LIISNCCTNIISAISVCTNLGLDQQKAYEKLLLLKVKRNINHKSVFARKKQLSLLLAFHQIESDATFFLEEGLEHNLM